MTISRRFLAVAFLLIVGCGLAPRAAIADVTGTTGSGVPFDTYQPSLATLSDQTHSFGQYLMAVSNY